MLILGHAGITLGAAALLAGAINSRNTAQVARVSWFTSLSHYIDIRLLLVGSVLPDIIDKPIGQYFFWETFGSGRIFGHTLLFLVVIATAGLLLYKLRQSIWLLTIAAGTFTHLILDEMWRNPVTFLWPFLGFTFERAKVTYWLTNILHTLLAQPSVYIPEVVGIVILLWFAWALVGRKKVGAFIKYGQFY